MIKKNIYSILVALLLLILSLSNAENFEKVQLTLFPNIDKVVHFGMYFVMMMVIIIEHRKNIKKPSVLFMIALIPLSYGILMEILQLTLTSTRSADFYDALFDAAGVLASVLLWLIIRPVNKEIVRSNKF
jgi:VanZ family protein